MQTLLTNEMDSYPTRFRMTLVGNMHEWEELARNGKKTTDRKKQQRKTFEEK